MKQFAYLLLPAILVVLAATQVLADGEPRSSDYWVVCNTCGDRDWAERAAANGGPEAGWYLLDDIFAYPGISWGHFTVTTCEDGVRILDQRDIESGNKKAEDATYTLAMHLLAAQLNFAAGACKTPEVEETARKAEALLVYLGFDGTGDYLQPEQSDYRAALDLADILYSYNLGELCP